MITWIIVIVFIFLQQIIRSFVIILNLQILKCFSY